MSTLGVRHFFLLLFILFLVSSRIQNNLRVYALKLDSEQASGEEKKVHLCFNWALLVRFFFSKRSNFVFIISTRSQLALLHVPQPYTATLFFLLVRGDSQRSTLPYARVVLARLDFLFLFRSLWESFLSRVCVYRLSARGDELYGTTGRELITTASFSSVRALAALQLLALHVSFKREPFRVSLASFSFVGNAIDR